ncbi:hypothetical protein POJ06DRAFT_262199 [Lipomyces tetrasporus]|uniref:Uncharacterized protein n=1 Tax=Lipomyces tetrasporus TaxID=54092 RepID=A0AAD7QKP1_9ASCO|nr:uncharacterized protein POJ06DRAFT_262199 [Lipomyces tetrasporus]KAJ8096991.1 hypothetical protein POJ06DRAFT_262199 [Lipomyces tetrasporus]
MKNSRICGLSILPYLRTESEDDVEEVGQFLENSTPPLRCLAKMESVRNAMGHVRLRRRTSYATSRTCPSWCGLRGFLGLVCVAFLAWFAWLSWFGLRGFLGLVCVASWLCHVTCS